MKLFTVGAANMSASYEAGRFVAESKEEAIEKARTRYATSSLGRQLNDAGAFRFYVTDEQKVDG
jgi:hypothetical protein